MNNKLFSTIILAVLILISPLQNDSHSEVYFSEGWESNNFSKNNWEKPSSPHLSYIVNDSLNAHSGNHYLIWAYEKGSRGGGWIDNYDFLNNFPNPSNIKEIYIRWYQKWSIGYSFSANSNKQIYHGVSLNEGKTSIYTESSTGTGVPGDTACLWNNVQPYASDPYNIGACPGVNYRANGKWFYNEIHIKIKPGPNNDVYERWVMEEANKNIPKLVYSRSNLNLGDNIGSNGVIRNFLRLQGDTGAYVVENNSYSYWDDIAVGDSYIGPLDGPPPDKRPENPKNLRIIDN